MNIYAPKDTDDIVISLKEYFKNNPFDIKDSQPADWIVIPSAMKGQTHSPEARKKISEANKIPKPQTKEHINLRIKNTTFTRKKKDNYGITEETKLKISKSNKGISKPMTEEHIKNLKCHTNNSTKVSCPHCNKIGQLTNMKRWHFDKCKLSP
jgi:hypothetical protein